MYKFYLFCLCFFVYSNLVVIPYPYKKKKNNNNNNNNNMASETRDSGS